ncbi:MAG: hypothetical protein RL260_3697 [Pseudomonadota bacterium]|jgi:hypothetical protein
MGLWDRDWYVDAQMKRMGLGGKPKPSRFSAKGSPPASDAPRSRMFTEQEVFEEAPPRPFRPLYRPAIDPPVAWAALFLGILVLVLVAAGALIFALKRWF